MNDVKNRYIVNAIGKNGETYLTQCQDKQTLKKWISDNKEKLIMDELKIVDKKKHPLLKFFSLFQLKQH
ncbi:hypothetical protein [Peribacillus alkalitolerans]|uniref:hypothetical protein n=1 Tax=Peribacillus alkalitolerans TaxID=1550385 RepID=UPI0013D88CBE|nr:hypothetical protein [Peribacillus alkalitolerans]